MHKKLLKNLPVGNAVHKEERKIDLAWESNAPVQIKVDVNDMQYIAWHETCSSEKASVWLWKSLTN